MSDASALARRYLAVQSITVTVLEQEPLEASALPGWESWRCTVEIPWPDAADVPMVARSRAWSKRGSIDLARYQLQLQVAEHYRDPTASGREASARRGALVYQGGSDGIRRVQRHLQVAHDYGGAMGEEVIRRAAYPLLMRGASDPKATIADVAHAVLDGHDQLRLTA